MQPLVDKLKSLIGGVQLIKNIELACQKEMSAHGATNKEEEMILADKIIENRKKNGWSQEELADKLGVSRQSVSKWEGAQAIPDMKKIVQLAELFGVTTDYLLKHDIEEAALTAPEYIAFSQEEDVPVKVAMEEANSFLAYNEKSASPI